MSQGKLAFAKSSFSGVHILLLLRMIASAGTDRGGGVVAGMVVVTAVTRGKERSEHAAVRERGRLSRGEQQWDGDLWPGTAGGGWPQLGQQAAVASLGCLWRECVCARTRW